MIKRHNVANVPPARLSSAALTAPVCLTSTGLVRVVAGPDCGPRRRGQLRNPVRCAHTVQIRCSARPLRQCRKTVRHACCASRSWTPHPLCAPVSTVSYPPPFNQWALTGTPRGSRRPTRAVIFLLVAVRGGFERPGESRPQRPTARALWPTGCPCNGLVSLPRRACKTQERARTLAGA